jgi:hypothetical protein
VVVEEVSYLSLSYHGPPLLFGKSSRAASGFLIQRKMHIDKRGKDAKFVISSTHLIKVSFNTLTSILLFLRRLLD